MDDAFFAGFTADLSRPHQWTEYWHKVKGAQSTPPPVPKIDGRGLFENMMAASRTPDPHMLPALLKLKASGKFLIAALSNTVIFPPDHELSRPLPGGGSSQFGGDVRALFDVFVSSAHVGLRKPDPAIYALALKEMDSYVKANAGGKPGLGWEEGVKADEVIFVDDIGSNCKAGRQAGFGTIKVNLGKVRNAVIELSERVDMQLLEERAAL
jgi:FMN phosphatase YigB (HAD superfamily)